MKNFSRFRFGQTYRRFLPYVLVASAALLAATFAQAANTIYTAASTGTPSTTGTATESTASYTQTGTVSLHTVPNGTDAGSVLLYSTVNTVALGLNLSLDQNISLGGLKNTNTGVFTIGAGGGNLTLDGTGLTAGNTPFGNAGVAFVAQTSGSGQMIVNAPVVMANTDLDVGTTSNSPVAIGGDITASTAQALNLRGNGAGGGITLSGSIGATGSNIAISNVGTGSGTITISGALGPKVTSFTQGSATSAVILSGSLAAFTGPITLSAGNLTLSGVGPASGNALTMSAGTTLTLTNTTNTSNDRITGDIVLGNSGGFNLVGNGATSSVTEAVSSLKIRPGSSTVTISGTGASRIQTLTATDLARTGNGTALIRGTSLGSAATNSTRITIGGTSGTGLTLIGTNTSSLGAVTSGTDKQLTIVPYLMGSTSATGVATNFLTYDINATTGGLRLLGVGGATAEQSLISSGATNDNVKTIAGANAVSAGAKVFNSLLIGAGTNSSTPATTAATVTGAGGAGDSLTLTSGALANVATGASGTGSISGFSSIIFGTTGANEAIITNANTNAAGTFTIGSPINTASAGGALTTTGGGITILTAANLYTGATNINQGTLQIGNGGTTGDLGTNAGVTVYSGATLNYNRANSYTINSVTGGGAVNSNNATGTLTLSQVGAGLALRSIGGVSGATVEFGGDVTGVTSIGDVANSGTPLYMTVAGQNYKFSSGTINLLDNGRGFTSNIEVSGGTLNLLNNNFSMSGISGGTQTLTISGGQINVPSSFGASGLNGNGGATQLGVANSTFTANQTGGVFSVTAASGRFDLGSLSGGDVTTYNLSGGTISHTVSTGGFNIGADGAGTSTTTFNLSGGKLIENTLISGASALVNTSSNLTTNATTSATVASTTGLLTGQLVTGTNITPGTTITAVNTTTKVITLSVAATGSGTNSTAFTSDPKQAFVWTGGTLATLKYDATNLTSTANATVTASTNTLTNGGGILSPGDIGTAGKTTIAGNYSVTSASAAYAVDIGGTTAASVFQVGSGSYDQILVTGTTALNGRLNVSLINGYTPPSDTTTLFAVLKGNTAATSTVTGAFTNQVVATSGNSRVVGADGLTSFLLAINNTATTATTGGLTSVAARNVALGGYQTTNTYSGAGTAWDTANAGAWANFDAGATASPATQASGAIAQFADGTASTGNISVSLNSTRNIQGIQFASTSTGGSARNYTISQGGSGAIILDNTSNSASASIADSSASGNANAINVPITLNSNLGVSVSNAANTLAIGGAISGSGKTLTKTGSGTLSLSGANTYSGATTVSAGTLLVSAGDINSSAVTVEVGAKLAYNSSTARTNSITLNGNGMLTRATLSGTGTISTALVLDNIGDTLSPGNSPGIQNFGTSQSWNAFTYVWELNSFTGTTAGTAFDQITITGGLALTGASGAYLLDITSLLGDNTPGNVPNFSEVNRSWTILTTTTGITGFNAANWTMGTTAFSSSPTAAGTWALTKAGNDLVLSYAVPEPATWALLAFSLTTVMVLRRRRNS